MNLPLTLYKVLCYIFLRYILCYFRSFEGGLISEILLVLGIPIFPKWVSCHPTIPCENVQVAIICK